MKIDVYSSTEKSHNCNLNLPGQLILFESINKLCILSQSDMNLCFTQNSLDIFLWCSWALLCTVPWQHCISLNPSHQSEAKETQHRIRRVHRWKIHHTQKDLKQAQTKLISCHLESEDTEETNAEG